MPGLPSPKTFGEALQLQGQDDKAEAYYQRALSILERSASAGGDGIAELKARLAFIAAKHSQEAQLGAAKAAQEPQASEPVRAPSRRRTRPRQPPVMAPSSVSALAPRKADIVATSRGAALDQDKADADTVPFFPWPRLPPRPAMCFLKRHSAPIRLLATSAPHTETA